MIEFRYLKPAGQAIFKDRYTKKAKELLTTWTKGKTISYGIVGLPLSKASISHSGAAFAPTAIREALQSYTVYSGEQTFDLHEEIVDFGDIEMHPTDINDSQKRIRIGLSDIFKQEDVKNWFLLGGDHSVSYSAIKAFREQYGEVGVIQFDAHHDLRNTEDGGPTNGTPFRRLLEDKVISGENLVQIGIRDFTNAKAYHTYAMDHGVTVYTMKQVRDQSLSNILTNEIITLAKRVDAIYLSVDMDVLDQAFAPGCPAIGPGGMDSVTLLQGIYDAAQHDLVKALDIVEIDPTLDFRNMTSRVAAYVLLEFMKGKSIGNKSVYIT
ncbi:formimidoylglutamase [Ornithinibacillus sp. BX22]|uniref:Formimidoylglutamase n=2 Tax=Ornithinibacillus TaxID=484508 RepID=A0A923L322_9BACI|nr:MULTISPECIES: formimidoylglutamase [Ornithinibacillus]MBC5635562.1 formimidoylglutamase [Ornithinibacillus hominis]MBS3679173.1 formimidoylglutamase [Ornithinibacillus massiliensis]